MRMRPAQSRTARRLTVGQAAVERLAFGHGTHAPVPAAVAAAELAHEPKPFSFTHLETWDWGWGGLLMFSILLFFRPQDQVIALGNAHLSEVAAIIGLTAMVMLNSKRREPLTRVTPELIGVMGLALVMLITIPTSFWPGGSFGVFKDIYIKVALVFMLMVNTVTSPRRIERICWVIVLAFGYISLRAWLDYARGVNLVEGGRVAGAAGGFFENPNDLALNLVAFLPLVFWPGLIGNFLKFLPIVLIFTLLASLVIAMFFVKAPMSWSACRRWTASSDSTRTSTRSTARTTWTRSPRTCFRRIGIGQRRMAMSRPSPADGRPGRAACPAR